MNLSKNSEPYDILICPISIILSQLHSRLKKTELKTTVTAKTTSLANTGGNKTCLDSPESKTYHYWPVRLFPWKPSFSDLVFIWPDSKFRLWEKPYSQSICWKQSAATALTLQLSLAVIQVGDEPNNLHRLIGNKISKEDFEKTVIVQEI